MEGLKFLSAFSTFALYLLLIQWNQKVFKGVLVVSFLLSIVYYTVLQTYGRFNFNFIASVFYTNSNESWSYFKEIPGKVYINLSIALLFVIIFLRFHFEKIKSKYFTYGLMIYLLIPPLIAASMKKVEKPIGKEELPYFGENFHLPIVKIPLFISHLASEVMEVNQKIKAEASLPDDWEITNPNEIKRKKNFVIVIGESLRKDVVQAYGFPDDNSPFLVNSNNIQLDNYLSMGSHTVNSLMRTLVRSDDFPNYKMSNNIVNLAKKAGYVTHWISNQGYLGIHDSPISMIAGASNHHFKNSGGDYADAPSDLSLLPVVKPLLRQGKEDQFIVVHTIGSHPSVCDITNGKYATFISSKDISCYSESVRILDHLLKEIYQELQATGESFQLLYFSDHGLMLTSDNRLVHAENIKQAYEVPFFIWGNEIKEKSKISAMRNGRGLIQLFCELNQIQTSNLQYNYRFLSEEKADYPVNEVMGGSDKIVDYQKMKSQPLPTE